MDHIKSIHPSRKDEVDVYRKSSKKIANEPKLIAKLNQRKIAPPLTNINEVSELMRNIYFHIHKLLI